MIGSRGDPMWSPCKRGQPHRAAPTEERFLPSVEMTNCAAEMNLTSYGDLRMKIKIIFLLLLTCIIYKGVSAQDIFISASVDNNKVTLGELVVLTININGNVRSIPEPNLPQLKDFDVYSSGRSQNVSIINGKMSASTNFSYVLAPKKEGDFVIGPVEVSFKKKVYKTEPITIEVGPSSQKQDIKSQRRSKTITGENKNRGKDIFIETDVNKKRAYFNEQITLTFKFYTKIRIFGEPEYIPPEKTGFWTEDLPPQYTYYENRDGSQYLVTEIKTALFPTTVGKLTIGPAALKYANNSDPFGFFSNPRPIVLKTEPIIIDVLPLPGNKPSYFKGAVGIYNIDSEINTNEIQAGKPINYKIKIKGEGNIKAVGEPDLGVSNDFKIYPSGSSDNIRKINYKVQGDKIYEYYLIPKKEGKKIICGMNFTYFNPEIEEYVTLKTKDIPITVKPGAVEEITRENSLFPSSFKEEVKLITKDIRPVKSDINLKAVRAVHEPLLLKNRLFILAISLPVLLLVFAKVYSKHCEQVEFNPVYKRDRGASRLVQKRFKEGKKLMSGDKSDYCHLIAGSILGFIGDKLNIAEMGLTSESLKDTLKGINIPEDEQKRIIEFLDKCDYIKFSPIEPESGWRNKIYHEAKDIISFLEKQKWQKR
ncbi:MAG: BatD family protein, partial [bacterium]